MGEGDIVGCQHTLRRRCNGRRAVNFEGISRTAAITCG
jgi:hypothetical protein